MRIVFASVAAVGVALVAPRAPAARPATALGVLEERKQGLDGVNQMKLESDYLRGPASSFFGAAGGRGAAPAAPVPRGGRPGPSGGLRARGRRGGSVAPRAA